MNKWLEHLGSQNLNTINKSEFLDDLMNLKGLAKVLQSSIIGKANSVMDKLALLDLKLKEQHLLDQEIEGVRLHGGNINSNLGDNLPWKERLEEIVTNAASVHSEFDVALYGMCEVIKRINFFVKNMQKTYVNPSTINRAEHETQYYPHDQIVQSNNHVFHSLGPKVGQYNESDPLMNGDKHLPGSKVRKDAHSHQQVMHNNQKKNGHVDQHLINEIKKHILPEIQKTIAKQVQEAVTATHTPDSHAHHADSHSSLTSSHSNNGETAQSILQKMTLEEAQLENLSHDKAQHAVQRKLDHAVNKKAHKVAAKTAIKVAQAPKVQQAQVLLNEALKNLKQGKPITPKVNVAVKKYEKVVNQQMVKQIKAIQQKTLQKLKKQEEHPVVNKPALGKAAAHNIVKISFDKAVQDLKIKNILKETKKAAKIDALRKTQGLGHAINAHHVNHANHVHQVPHLNPHHEKVNHNNILSKRPAAHAHIPHHAAAHHRNSIHSNSINLHKVEEVNKSHVIPAAPFKSSPIQQNIAQAANFNNSQAQVALAAFHAAPRTNVVNALNSFAKDHKANNINAAAIPHHVENRHNLKAHGHSAHKSLSHAAVAGHIDKKQVKELKSLFVATVRAAIHAEKASKSAKSLAVKANTQAAHHPSNPIIQEAKKIAIKNAHVANQNAHKAAVAVQKAKDEVKALKTGHIPPTVAIFRLTQNKIAAQKAEVKALAAPKKTVEIARKAAHYAQALKHHPTLQKQEIKTAVKLIKTVVNSALKAEHAAQQARTLAQKAQKIATQQPYNPVIRQATQIAVKNAQIAQQQAKIAAGAVAKTKQQAKALKSGHAKPAEIFENLRQLSHQAKSAMHKAQAAPAKTVQVTNSIKRHH